MAPEPRIIIVVVHLEGCPACEDYVPRLRALSGSYERMGIPVLYVDANDQRAEAQRWMDEYDIQEMPSTLVIKNEKLGGGKWKMAGALDDRAIRQMLDFAYAEARR